MADQLRRAVIPVVGPDRRLCQAVVDCLIALGLDGSHDPAALASLDRLDARLAENQETDEAEAECRRLFSEAFADVARPVWASHPRTLASWMRWAPLGRTILVLPDVPPEPTEAAEWLGDVVAALRADPLAALLTEERLFGHIEDAVAFLAELGDASPTPEAVAVLAGTDRRAAPTRDGAAPGAGPGLRLPNAVRRILVGSDRATINAIVELIDERTGELGACRQAAAELRSELEAARIRAEDLEFTLRAARRRENDALARTAELERLLKVATAPRIVVADEESG